MVKLTDYSTFSSFFLAAQAEGRGIIPAGVYEDSAPWVMAGDRKVRDPLPVKIEAHGAIKKTRGLEVSRSRVTVEGLTIQNAEVGFRFIRGQGSQISGCTAEHCDIGYAWACGEYANSQVTYSHFTNLIARHCQMGYYIDGNAISGRSWCNANEFDIVARSCKHSLYIDSRHANYNRITIQAEANEHPVMMGKSRSNTLLAPHIHDTDEDGVSLYAGPNTFIWGGRIKGRVTGSPQIVTNSGVRGEGSLEVKLDIEPR